MTPKQPVRAERMRRRNLLRRLYDWVLSWAESPFGTWALLVLAFAEASFFPVPPDVLLMALILGERRKAFWYGCVCTAGSLLGAVLGYVIGWKLWQAVDEFFFAYIIDRADFVKVCQAYQEHLFLAVFTAAFTFIPFKVFTIASGVAAGGNWQAFGLFMLASLLGRGVRFFGVSGLMYLFGPRMKALIEKYFNLLCLILLLLLVLGFLLVKWLS